MKSFQPPEWCNFPPDLDKNLSLAVQKGDTVQDFIPLAEKTHFVVGRLPLCDVSLAHQSVSRQHAMVAHHEKEGIYLFDLSSTHGTYVDGQKMYGTQPVRLYVGSVIQFGASTRTYRLCVKPEGSKKHLTAQNTSRNKTSRFDDKKPTVGNTAPPTKTGLEIGPQFPMKISPPIQQGGDASEDVSGDVLGDVSGGVSGVVSGDPQVEQKSKSKKRKTVGFDVAAVLKDVPWDPSSKKGKFEGLISSEVVIKKKQSTRKSKNPFIPDPRARLAQVRLVGNPLKKLKPEPKKSTEQLCTEELEKAGDKLQDLKDHKNAQNKIPQKSSVSSSSSSLSSVAEQFKSSIMIPRSLRTRNMSLYGSLPAPHCSPIAKILKTPTSVAVPHLKLKNSMELHSTEEAQTPTMEELRKMSTPKTPDSSVTPPAAGKTVADSDTAATTAEGVNMFDESDDIFLDS